MISDSDIPTHTRVLLADDFQSWRRVFSSELQKHSNFQVVGEASDGPEAIQKAEQLKPDVILLDVAMPSLDGITAARQICKVSPDSKILFVSLLSGPELVRASFAAGGRGYLLKSNSGKALISAIDSVLRGDLFVDPDICVRGFCGDHVLHLYHDDSSLCDFLHHLIADPKRDRPILMLLTKYHLELLAQRREIENQQVIGSKRSLFFQNSEDLLAACMDVDLPDATKLETIIDGLIKRSRNGVVHGTSLLVIGEMAPLVLHKRNGETALRLEQLWNESIQAHDAELRCIYPANAFSSQHQNANCKSICAQHSAIVGT